MTWDKMSTYGEKKKWALLMYDQENCIVAF